MNKLLEEIKAAAKVYIDANIWDGDDRAGCKSDFASFNPDNLQEVIDDMLDDIIADKFSKEAVKVVANVLDAENSFKAHTAIRKAFKVK